MSSTISSNSPHRMEIHSSNSPTHLSSTECPQILMILQDHIRGLKGRLELHQANNTGANTLQDLAVKIVLMKNNLDTQNILLSRENQTKAELKTSMRSMMEHDDFERIHIISSSLADCAKRIAEMVKGISSLQLELDSAQAAITVQNEILRKQEEEGKKIELEILYTQTGIDLISDPSVAKNIQTKRKINRNFSPTTTYSNLSSSISNNNNSSNSNNNNVNTSNNSPANSKKIKV